ncbi:MAG: hypothetical protein JSR77_02555 [Planctomycetes bacterium]|nr:hypothetical protein [Planctomycetota bacterium]
MDVKRGLFGLCAMILCAAGTAQAANNPEVEPNDTKATATIANSGGAGMDTGDTISGTTTGSSTTTAGAASADYFLVTTKARPQGVYRHRLILTSSVAGHTFTIRGLGQSGGVPNTTDSTMQTGSTTYPGTPTGARVIQWYGFGKQERIFVRVTGTTTTTAAYSAVLDTTPVTPVSMSGSVLPGDITIKPDAATATAIDTDWWVLGPGYTAIPDFGHDDADETGALRNMTPGLYTIALGRYNTCNNLGSPADDTFRSAIVLDFPDAMANSSTTLTTSATMVADANGNVVSGTSSSADQFGIMFFSLNVEVPTGPTPPVCNLTLNPASVGAGASTLITVNVTPGLNPDTTPHMVTADLSSIGGPSNAVFTEGATNSFTYRVTTSGCLTAGSFPISATVTEIAAPHRSSSCTRTLAVTAPATGACCLPSTQTCEITTSCDCAARGGSYQGDGSFCDSSAAGDPFVSEDSFPISIPDYATVPGVATSTITISNGQTVEALSVCVGLTHTFAGDLIVTLDNGNHSVQLSNRQGTLNNLGGTYCFSDQATVAWPPAGDPIPAGTYRPFSPLSAFAGDSYDATWTLTVSDNAGLDVGTIDSFSITPLSLSPACSFCPSCPADYNQDGGVDGADVGAFFPDWENSAACADVNLDGGIDGGDVEAFFAAWEAGDPTCGH